MSKGAGVVNDPRCIQFEITMAARNVDSAVVTGRCIGDTILLGDTFVNLYEQSADRGSRVAEQKLGRDGSQDRADGSSHSADRIS